MVHVVEGVLLVVDHVLHLLFDLAALGVIEDEELLLSFGIVRHVEVLVLVDEGLEHAVVTNALEASLAELAQILLHALHLKEHLLGKDRELSHYIVKTLLVSEVIVALLHIGDLTQGFYQLAGSRSNESIQHLFEVTTTRSREDLHLLGVDKVVVASALAEESLQVEFALIDKLRLLVSDGLLGWQLGNEKAWESLLKGLV